MLFLMRVSGGPTITYFQHHGRREREITGNEERLSLLSRVMVPEHEYRYVSKNQHHPLDHKFALAGRRELLTECRSGLDMDFR